MAQSLPLGPRDPRSPGTGAACGCADCGPGGAPGTVGPAAWGWGRGRGACEGGAPPYTWLLSKRALTPPPQFVTSLISAVSNGSKHSVAQLALVFSPGASSTLWASARSQKVGPRVGCKDATRRGVYFCPTGYEQCTGSGKPPLTVQQAGRATPDRGGKNIRTAWHPSTRPDRPSATVRAHMQGRWRRPVAGIPRTPRLA